MFGIGAGPIGRRRPSSTGYEFTNAVRTILMRANQESLRLGHAHVGTEHLLLAVTRDTEVIAILERLSVSPEEIRTSVERQVVPGSRQTPSREFPYTSHSRKAVDIALAEGRKHGRVESRHLLLGLLGVPKSLAARVLAAAGVTVEGVRRLSGSEVEEARDGFRVRIDDTSDRSIHEQIIDQVTEAVATGTLQPGQRLPTVRFLADVLEVAPGTVARAYAELERREVVVTEGARGTRVADRDRPPVPEADRSDMLTGLLRPVVVAAFHLGATAEQLRESLEAAMRGIFDRDDQGA